MKVKIVATLDGETKFADLPMSTEKLLELRASVLDRNTVGYIPGADVKCYDEQGNEIENIFKYNESLM